MLYSIIVHRVSLSQGLSLSELPAADPSDHLVSGHTVLWLLVAALHFLNVGAEDLSSSPLTCAADALHMLKLSPQP